MENFELFVKIFAAIISSILIPLITWLINISREKRKINLDQLKLNLENAKNFELIKKSGTKLEKDRSAKITFNDNNLTFDEVDYLNRFYNADYWISYYSKVKNKLELIRNDKNEVVSLKKNFTTKDRLITSLEYVVSFTLFSLPFFFMDKYTLILKQSLYTKFYPITFILIAWPCAFLYLIFITLREGRKQTEATNFIKKLESTALVLPPEEDSTIDKKL